MHSNLSKYGKDVRRYLLNGMAYEIYFDNKAHLRRKFKIHKYEEVLSELLSSEGNESRKFICNQLEDFEQKVFYVPGGEKIKITVAFNECFEEYGEEDSVYCIEGIYMEGQNILYTEDGTELYQYSEAGYFHRKMDITELESFLRENLVVTRRSISIDYVLFKASAAIPRIYRLKSQREIYKDLRILEKSIGEGDEENSNLDLFSMEMFENISYTMAKHAVPKIPNEVDEWLDGFNTFSIYQVLPQLIELWRLNVKTDVEAKKTSPN